MTKENEAVKAFTILAAMAVLTAPPPIPLACTNGGRGIPGKKKAKNKDKRRLRKLKKESQRRNR